jgi:hypothetical protein
MAFVYPGRKLSVVVRVWPQSALWRPFAKLLDVLRIQGAIDVDLSIHACGNPGRHTAAASETQEWPQGWMWRKRSACALWLLQ